VTMKWAISAAVIFLSTAIFLASLTGAQPAVSHSAASRIGLTSCHVPGVKDELRCGVYDVFENRRIHKGRRLPLKIVLIPARSPHPDQGPIFYLTGGPGETATEAGADLIASGECDEHDVVLLDERGTGDGHRLDCPALGSGDNLQGYLRAPFDPTAADACRRELERRYDLSQYSTAAFAIP